MENLILQHFFVFTFPERHDKMCPDCKFSVLRGANDGFQLLCAHFAHALYRALGADAQRPAREHPGAQPHGRGARARARRDPARHLPQAVRRQRPCDGGAVSRRVRDPHRRPADTDQVSQRRDHVGLPRGGGSGRAEAARHAAAGAAGDLCRRARRGQGRRHLPAREGGRQALGLHQVYRGAPATTSFSPPRRRHARRSRPLPCRRYSIFWSISFPRSSAISTSSARSVNKEDNLCVQS